MVNKMDFVRVFELYSGIGGMHLALKETELNAKVVRAIDINPTANTVYRLNFPDVVLLEKNIQGLTEADFNKYDINMITMSPPCQPFTRNGLRKDLNDERNLSILHIINLIPKLNTVQYILVENVKGFETSDVRNDFTCSLTKSGFSYQEFLLSPEQFGIPNSRLRYYLLAKRLPLEFCFTREHNIKFGLPELDVSISTRIENMNYKYKTLAKGDSCFEVGTILSETNGKEIPVCILGKYGSILDIVNSESTRTCCFTKSYGRYVEGTGSVFSQASRKSIENLSEELKQYEKGTQEYLAVMKSMKLRYFSPEEVSKLMCFPKFFKFPVSFSDKQKYRLLGNSINVHVVAVLMAILIS